MLNLGQASSMEAREVSHKTMPYWCKDCRKYSSVKIDSPLEKSPIFIAMVNGYLSDVYFY